MGNILITSAGQRVSLVKLFRDELQKIDENSKVYTVDLHPQLAPACYVSNGYKAVPRVTDENYIAELLKICKEWSIQLIVPTIDTELQILSDNRELFLQEGITPVISSVEVVAACRDKRILKKKFVENGFDIPKPMCKENLTFPLFVKPCDGSCSKGAVAIQSEEEFKASYFADPKLMFMEYIDHDEFDEYTVDCYYNKQNEVCCVVPRKRIFVRAGEVSKGVTHKNEIVQYIKERLSHLSGAIGCLTMQFFFNQTTKRMIGIEINPRFGGGFPLSYLAGANYPGWLIKEYILGESVEYFDGWEENLLMLRYDGEVLVRNYKE